MVRSMSKYLLPFLGVMLSLLVQPAKATDYAVLSLVGDEITVAVYSGETGTHLPPLRKDVAPVGVPALDDAALLGAADAVKQTHGAGFKLYTTNDRSLYDMKDALFAADAGGNEARALVGRIVGDKPVDYVIVLSKYRSKAYIKMPAFNLYHGSGDLEGLGYYVDNSRRVRDDEGARGKGFLSSYAYLKATLLDGKTLQVLASRPVTGSDTTINVNVDAFSWRILSEEQKSAALEHTVRNAAHDAVTQLLQQAVAAN